MDNIFLDANILFSAAYRDNARILQLWKLPDIKLITSHYAAEEARRNLKQEIQLNRFEKLLTSINLSSTGHDDRLIPDEIKLRPKDRPILAAAIAVKATHLLTGDYKDFGQYYRKTISGVVILPPVEYMLLHSTQDTHIIVDV